MQLGNGSKDLNSQQNDEENESQIKSEANVEDDIHQECEKVARSLESDNDNEDAAPIGLDAIASDGTVVKSTEQEVINMLLAQHGILTTSGSLDVSALTASHSNLTFETSSIVRSNVHTGEHKSNDIDLPTMVQPADIGENASSNQDSADGEQTTELNSQSHETDDGSHAYLTSISSTDITDQIAANAGYGVTAFVADDGQGGHIIISGGDGYQDGSVVSISGHQVVSTVTDNQLMTLAGNDNVSVSMAGLENFASEHVRISSNDADDEASSTPYYVLEGSVTIPDVHSQIDSNEHDLPKKIYQCSMEGCQKQFSTPYRLKAHGRSHTGRTFPCEENGCHKTFITPSDLNKHSRTHTGDKPFFCDVENCGKVYSTAHHLKVHKRSHTGDKPFVCEWDSCGKSFSTGYGLKSHYRTHTGERPYKCPESVCDKAFKTSGDLQKHIRTHTGERPFKCLFDGCDRSFTTSNIRKVHMRTHTGERPYVCEIEGCDRSFASATNYKNHSRIHTGERPYACEVPGCNKSFTEYSSLYKHNVVHTQQKPYICNICHKTYRQTSTLAMHKRTVHGATEDSNQEAEADTTEETNEDMEPSTKRQKLSFDSNSALTTALVQGLPVMLNDEGSMTALQTQYAELAAQQQLTDGTSLSGAIAIPIQVTMNPDGTIAGAHGINLTDNTGRIIPVSLSLSLPISSFANSLSETQNDDSIVTSEAVAAASAVNEIFSNQQDQSGMGVPLTTEHVITEQIDNHNVISHDDDHADGSLKNEDGNERQRTIVSDALGNQILITTVTESSNGLSSSDTTTVRIAPRDYSHKEIKVDSIERTGNGSIPDSNTSSEGVAEPVVAMIIDDSIAQEQEEGDVTDRYLIKESLEVHERITTSEVCTV